MKERNIANFQKQPFAFVLSIRCSLKEVKFFKIDRNATGAYFWYSWWVKFRHFIIKMTPLQVFSDEFSNIFKNTSGEPLLNFLNSILRLFLKYMGSYKPWTHPHPAKKRSHPPIPSQENVILTHTQPKKRSHLVKKMSL